jgi:hypothetical protein
MGAPPLGFAESRNASNYVTITLPEASSTTPRIIQEVQEVLASGEQALKIAFQLTVSG